MKGKCPKTGKKCTCNRPKISHNKNRGIIIPTKKGVKAKY